MLFYLEHWGGAAERPILQRVTARNLSPTALSSPQNRTLELLGWGELLHETADQPGPNLHGHGLFEVPR